MYFLSFIFVLLKDLFWRFNSGKMRLLLTLTVVALHIRARELVPRGTFTVIASSVILAINKSRRPTNCWWVGALINICNKGPGWGAEPNPASSCTIPKLLKFLTAKNFKRLLCTIELSVSRKNSLVLSFNSRHILSGRSVIPMRPLNLRRLFRLWTRVLPWYWEFDV